MAFSAPTDSHPGQIGTVTIGTGDKAVTIGGQKAMAFHDFDGDEPNKPRLAVEVFDSEPTEWPQVLADVTADQRRLRGAICQSLALQRFVELLLDQDLETFHDVKHTSPFYCIQQSARSSTDATSTRWNPGATSGGAWPDSGHSPATIPDGGWRESRATMSGGDR